MYNIYQTCLQSIYCFELCTWGHQLFCYSIRLLTLSFLPQCRLLLRLRIINSFSCFRWEQLCNAKHTSISSWCFSTYTLLLIFYCIEKIRVKYSVQSRLLMVCVFVCTIQFMYVRHLRRLKRKQNGRFRKV